ncbi:hypothetical protein [Bifidobacterium bombi]|uniref:Uncharacterized protein n=1 Tax=Bifidobacterium bombi DSM 19703 TaxID=1341695 RepID=A0A080N6J0_9BIFI|nr:hypothetical protein [Bifidobacterium bombi]KFF31664.1 hypothetical protein BBOMB_1051 [Bifidobacterium bombi DSM 19703]
MKQLTIVTAKIEPGIYRRIEQGTKHYEVRTEPINGDVIRYIDAQTGSTLGNWKLEGVNTTEPLTPTDGIGSVHKLEAWKVDEQHEKIMALADINRAEFVRLFGGIDYVCLRRIGRPLPDGLDALMGALDDEQTQK